MQFALSDPVTTTIDPQFRFIEDNGWPNVELRLAFSSGPLEQIGFEAIRPFETGVSAVVGQLRNTDPLLQRNIANVWGLAADYRWQFTEAWGITGEIYTGEALGTYNGAILQNFNNLTGKGIRSTGGWIETFAYWRENLHSHVGYATTLVSGHCRWCSRRILWAGRTYNAGKLILGCKFIIAYRE